MCYNIDIAVGCHIPAFGLSCEVGWLSLWVLQPSAKNCIAGREFVWVITAANNLKLTKVTQTSIPH